MSSWSLICCWIFSSLVGNSAKFFRRTIRCWSGWIRIFRILICRNFRNSRISICYLWPFFGLGSLGAPLDIISFSLLGLMRDAFNVVVETKFTNRWRWGVRFTGNFLTSAFNASHINNEMRGIYKYSSKTGSSSWTKRKTNLRFNQMDGDSVMLMINGNGFIRMRGKILQMRWGEGFQ